MKITKLTLKLLLLILLVTFAFCSCELLTDLLENPDTDIGSGDDIGDGNNNDDTPSGEDGNNTKPNEHIHEYSKETTPSTCTYGGYTTYTCECGYEYDADETDPLGHTEIVVSAVAPTCTTAGKTEGKRCYVCGTVTVPQTTVKAIGHKEVTDAAIAPTCTTEGKTEGKHCSTCGTVTVPQNVLNAKGHTEVTDSAIAPTCTSAGKTAGKHCSICGTVTVEQKVISSTGHKYTNGECTSCGAKDPNFTPSIDGEFDYSKIPEWSGDHYVIINGNVPYFTENEITDESFESYSELDALGRAQVAFASLGKDLMPTGTRPSLSFKPTGWVQVTYPTNIVPQGQIYNRSHLIAWSLAGEGNNKLNLITGTPYFNQIGMQIFENQILDYIRETDNHVMYRVTPIYVDNELVARGVLMEAWSVEDDGDGICFNVFMYNVQPNITIDYATGENWKTPTEDDPSDDSQTTIATLVTNISQLKEGDKIIIVSKTSNYAMGALSSSGNNRSAIEITKNGNTVTLTNEVQIITLGVGNSNGTYSLKVGDNYLYAASSASNHLKEQTTLNANGSWSITIAADGTATVKATGTNTRNWLRFNNSNKLFSTYASGQNDVCIYVITEQG